jgi:hypothetical protein
VKKLLIAVAVVLAAALVFVAAIFAVSEAGEEIVVLLTREADGSTVETRLWVVEDGGHTWLRSGQPGSGWLQRIEADPRVEVTRDGATAHYTAVPVRDPEARDRIHALIRERYGWADGFVSMIRDGSLSVAVRLDPIPE